MYIMLPPWFELTRYKSRFFHQSRCVIEAIVRPCSGVLVRLIVYVQQRRPEHASTARLQRYFLTSIVSSRHFLVLSSLKDWLDW